jgi:hypothetical protein
MSELSINFPFEIFLVEGRIYNYSSKLVFSYMRESKAILNWLFVNWAAKFIDGQQNYLFGQQKIYFFGQPFS